MKLLNKQEGLFINKEQKLKVAVALAVITLVLYAVAMVFSLCGSKIFILDYQNEWLDKVGEFLTKYNLIRILSSAFLTIEIGIVLWFGLQRVPKWYYLVFFWLVPLIPQYIFGSMSRYYYFIIQMLFYVFVPLIEAHVSKVENYKKYYLFSEIRICIALAISLLIEAMIFVIKAGYFDGENHTFTLSANFAYSIENDIALLVILNAVSLLIHREKGRNKQWTIIHGQSGSSQTLMAKSQKSLQKKSLSKSQKNKLRLLIARVYLVQIGAFVLVMVLPFLLGKTLEYLTMYVSFIVVRYILGFKYSLHFKREAICVSVSVLIFGCLSLVVPFFFVNIIISVLFGSVLAIILHLSYKYKGMFLFLRVANTDRYAELYVLFDGDISKRHVLSVCIYCGIDREKSELVYDFMQKEKISYLALKYHYSQRSICYKIDEAIECLKNNC